MYFEQSKITKPTSVLATAGRFAAVTGYILCITHFLSKGFQKLGFFWLFSIRLFFKRHENFLKPIIKNVVFRLFYYNKNSDQDFLNHIFFRSPN